jgi:DNA-binding CsgD family transcriptional regulator
MFVMERMGDKEIARQLGIGVSSSASQLLRAKRILAKEINDYIKRNN